MKISDTRLDSIRSLVKKLAKKTDQVGGAESVGSAQKKAATGSKGTVGGKAEVSAAGYGELKHAVGEKRLERDVRLVLEASDPIRDKRIQDLKAKIDAGQYSVDPESVAERMLRSGHLSDLDD